MSRAKTKTKKIVHKTIAQAPHNAIVPRSIVEQTKAFTAPRGRLEMGGVLVGHVDEEGNNVVVAGLFPRQTEATPGYCEFEGKWMTIACAAADHANESVTSIDGSHVPTIRIIGWIHTHPGLDIFLSGIDIATYQQMLKFTPDGRFVAVVVDPLTAKDGVFLTPDMPNTFSSAKGKAKLCATLRERYLSFLAKMESLREKRGREEMPFIITGDLHRDHVSRGFVDDFMLNNLDSIHYTKLEVNGLKEHIEELYGQLAGIKGEMTELATQTAKIGEISRSSRENGVSLKVAEGSLKNSQMDISALSSNIEDLVKSNREHSLMISGLNSKVRVAETRIDGEISSMINDHIELEERLEEDRRNIVLAHSILSGLERSVESQSSRNKQLGDLVEEIGSLARKPRRVSRKQAEREEWDAFHSKISNPNVSNAQILREHFSLIAMNRSFCLAVFKRIKNNQSTEKDDRLVRLKSKAVGFFNQLRERLH